MSPVKIEEEKNANEFHICPYSLVIVVFVPYLTEMSSINFTFSVEIILFDLDCPCLVIKLRTMCSSLESKKRRIILLLYKKPTACHTIKI